MARIDTVCGVTRLIAMVRPMIMLIAVSSARKMLLRPGTEGRVWTDVVLYSGSSCRLYCRGDDVRPMHCSRKRGKLMENLEKVAGRLWSSFLWEQMRIKNLNQIEMAKKLQVSQPRLNEWLNGVRLPRLTSIVYACQVLGVDFLVSKGEVKCRY